MWSNFATEWGSKRTHVPMRNKEMRPRFACLKIVMRETATMLASSLAVLPGPSRYDIVFSLFSFTGQFATTEIHVEREPSWIRIVRDSE